MSARLPTLILCLIACLATAGPRAWAQQNQTAAAERESMVQAEDQGCGADGWGWKRGELISRVQHPNRSSSEVRYSHFGLAVLGVSSRNGDAEVEIMPSGVKPGTPGACLAQRIHANGGEPPRR